MKQRLDQFMAQQHIAPTRSQAESYIKLGLVLVNKKIIKKTGYMVSEADHVELTEVNSYVSRAGLKLASVSAKLGLDFRQKTVLDVGSSTGGFTDYALQNGASKIIAVDVGTDQLHPTLLANPKIELHEKTDIRNFTTDQIIDIVVIDVSFISLRQILPHISLIVSPKSLVVAMLKPQFEAGQNQVNKGVIKNDHIRRDIIKGFEKWVTNNYKVIKKADSEIAGAKGNLERFYLLQKS